MRNTTRLLPGSLALVALSLGAASAQTASCGPPLCVSRADDDASAPVPGMLRYAVNAAGDGGVITFDPALNGKTIELDRRSAGNHINMSKNMTLAGPGAGLLSVSGGNATRIFVVSGASVHIQGLTLTAGSAKGGDGGIATGGAGGGGGGAGLGGAVLLNSGSLTLTAVVLRGNRSTGGNGGPGGGGFGAGRGGVGGSAIAGLATNGDGEGSGGIGGNGNAFAEPGGEGGWGGGGGGGGFAVNPGGGRGAPGGPSGFAGGVGGAGGFMDSDEGGWLAAGGGYGGSALGGAIFVRSGELKLYDTELLSNTAAGGLGATGSPNGIAKGGALFICTSSFCGPGHDGVAMLYGKTVFKANSALQAADDPACAVRDDADVCGPTK